MTATCCGVSRTNEGRKVTAKKIAAALCAAVTLTIGAGAAAQASPLPEPPGKVVAKAEKARAIIKPGSTVRGALVELGCTVTNGGTLPNGRYAVLTAGHCFGDASDKRSYVGDRVYGEYSNTESIGKVIYSSAKLGEKPDYGIVELDPDIGMKVASKASGTATKGEKVCSLGRWDGYTCGTVYKVDDRYTYVKMPRVIPGNSGSALFNSRGEPVALLSRVDMDKSKDTPIPYLSGYAIYENLGPILRDAEATTGFCAELKYCL